MEENKEEKNKEISEEVTEEKLQEQKEENGDNENLEEYEGMNDEELEKITAEDEDGEKTEKKLKPDKERSYGLFGASFLNRVGDILILHFSCLICCLPVITIGASLSATMYAGMKMANGMEGNVFRTFIKGFKDNFKRSTLYFLLTVLSGAVLFFSLNYWLSLEISIGTLCGMFCMGLIVVWAMTVLYLFAVQAKFENTFGTTIKNSLLMAVRDFPTTLLMIGIIAAVLYLAASNSIAQWVFVISGLGILGYVLGILFNRVFVKYIQ